MLYQVPQFIEVEDKILGPLTMKQLFILAGIGLGLFMLYYVFQFWLFISVSVVTGAIAVALVFGKIQGRPLVHILGSIISYYLNPRLYLWERKEGSMVGGMGAQSTKGKLQEMSAKLHIGNPEE